MSAQIAKTPAFVAGNLSEEWKKNRADLEVILPKNELNGKSAYIVLHAEKSNSGYSIGNTQSDMAAQDGRRQELLTLLGKRPSMTKERLAKIETGLRTKADSKALSTDDQTAINDVLKLPEGMKMVDKWDSDQIDHVQGKISEVIGEARKNPRYATDTKFQEFVESQEFKALAGDNINQFGEPDSLKKWLRGEEVSFENGARKAQLGSDQDLDFGAFAEFESKYQDIHGNKAMARNVAGRRMVVAEQVKKGGEWRTKIGEHYRSDAERKAGIIDPQFQDLTGKHQVKSGDNLWDLATKHGTTVEELKKLNNLTSDKLSIDQVLVLPSTPKESPKPDGKEIKGDAGNDDLGKKEAFADFWKPGPTDPLDKPVRDWSVEDLASAMTHPDYGRTGGPTTKQRHAMVGEWFRDHADEDNGSTGVLSALTHAIDERRNAVRPAEGSFERFREDLLKVDHPANDLLVKPIADWTADEAKQAVALGSRIQSHDPRFQPLQGRIADWFLRTYGDAPQATDETGKPIEPQPIVDIPRRPMPLQTADGKPLSEGLLHLGKKMAEASGPNPAALSKAIRAMQRGLNMVEPSAQIDEDGILGPQTRGALRAGLVNHGEKKLEEGFAIGRFKDHARDGTPKTEEDLNAFATGAFGGLHQEPGRALQQTMNRLGPKAFGEDGWEPLKEDNWIGPKTTDAFNLLSRATKPDDFADLYREDLGFEW